jgi:type III restriction enzyme
MMGLQDDNRVVVYTKLPTKKFVVPTPLGDYTPDWAIVLDEHGEKKLYFVVETKVTLNKDDMRGNETWKILFGEKRFKDVGGAAYVLSSKHEDFKRVAAKAIDDGDKTKIL